ncbi:unnamed protein product [Adineta ricciae]|uniref:Amidase domain-containing protein n=1 Tax=Adineta ricciae TaxID=249248 RepID=A0A815NG46_ADIRI|nr:unnamed protein product [Adineta ricciae]CAF1431496.1 unnamed protein product [Adineta ricciae]
MQGRRNASGWMKWIDRIAEDDALMLKILYEVATVFYVRTSQPQTLVHTECDSAIYGTLVNSFNRNLSSDGSSDGEGTLLDRKGSVMEVGAGIGEKPIDHQKGRNLVSALFYYDRAEEERNLSAAGDELISARETYHARYAQICNLLGYPTAIFPVITVDLVKDEV